MPGRRAPTRRRTEGYLEFPMPLFVEKDLLGQEFPVLIGGLRVKLQFPIPRSPSPAAEPRFLEVPAPLPAEVEGLLPPPVRWGEETPSGAFVHAVRVKGIVTVVGNRCPQPISDLHFSARPWFECARDWIAAWSGQPRLVMLISKEAPSFGLSYNSDVGRTVYGGSAVPSLVVRMGRLKAANAQQVRSGLKMASAGQLAPFNRRLLLDARDQLLRGDTRRAIIDVATAVEISFADAITSHLYPRRLSGAFVDRIVTKANGLTDLFDFYKSLALPACPVSREKIMNQLADPRNKAVHAGSSPSTGVVSLAIQVGQEVIDAISPMPPVPK